MMITPNFCLEEWSQPSRYNLPESLYPDEWIIPRLHILCNLLEELRAYLICPIKIISGYRTHEWNERHILAGHNAAKDSMHCHGVAADIRINSYESCDIYGALIHLDKINRIKIGGLGIYASFVHVDVRHILPDMPQKLVTWQG